MKWYDRLWQRCPKLRGIIECLYFEIKGRGKKMSIEKDYREYQLVCDICGGYVPGFETYQDALDYAKEMGWTTKRERGEWVNCCEDCL
jgi:hypothetical protein